MIYLMRCVTCGQTWESRATEDPDSGTEIENPFCPHCPEDPKIDKPEGEVVEGWYDDWQLEDRYM